MAKPIHTCLSQHKVHSLLLPGNTLSYAAQRCFQDVYFMLQKPCMGRLLPWASTDCVSHSFLVASCQPMTLLLSWFSCQFWQHVYCNLRHSCCCRSPLTTSSSEWPMDHIEDVATPAEAGAAMMDPLAEATGVVGAVVGPRECHMAPHQWMHPQTSWLPTSVTMTSHVMQHAHNVWLMMALRKGRAGVLPLAGDMPGVAVQTAAGVAALATPLKK